MLGEQNFLLIGNQLLRITLGGGRLPISRGTGLEYVKRFNHALGNAHSV
jgi:hypothetical protein